jgi:formylglycine-generating enzyme required for sulfatase activity
MKATGASSFEIAGQEYRIVQSLTNLPTMQTWLCEGSGRRIHLCMMSGSGANIVAERARKIREGASGSGLVVPLETGEQGGQVYVLRAWVDAEPFDVFAKRFRFAPKRQEHALNIGVKLCRAVEGLHNAGLVHGALKNSNVFFEKDGSPIVTDPLLSGDATKKCDPREDVRALGLLLCRLYSGKPELAINDYTLMMLARAKVSRQLIRVLWQAIHHEPSMRFPDASTLGRALREVPLPEYQRTVQVRALPDNVGPSDGLPTWLRNAALFVGVVGLIVLASWSLDKGEVPKAAQAVEKTPERETANARFQQLMQADTQAVSSWAEARNRGRVWGEFVISQKAHLDLFELQRAESRRDHWLNLRLIEFEQQGRRYASAHIGDGVDMTFVWIPPGRFTMGSPSTERHRESDEGPATVVTLTRGFYMGITEVTQAQWESVMQKNNSRFRGPTFPVETVSWNDCVLFARRLSTQLNRNVQLPSEAQWEYAARAGSQSAYHFGADASALDQYEWYKQNSGGTTRPVGTKPPNAFGVHDMLGNLTEWTRTLWSPNHPGGNLTDPEGEPQRPRGAPTPGGLGNDPIMKAGSWDSDPPWLRAANRHRAARNWSGDFRIGFRVIIEPDKTDALAMNPVNLSVFRRGGQSFAVAAKNDFAYIAANEGGVVVVDITDPRTPKAVNKISTEGPAGRVFIHGNQLAVLTVRDFSRPKTTSSFLFFDLANPANPTPLANFSTEEIVDDVAFKGNYAYLAKNSHRDGQKSGILVLDLTGVRNGGPFTIVQVNSIDTHVAPPDRDGNIWGATVAVVEDFLLLNDHSNGLIVFDISNPASPREARRLAQGEINRGQLFVSDGLVYWSQPDGIIRVEAEKLGTSVQPEILNIKGGPIEATEGKLFVRLGRYVQIYDTDTQPFRQIGHLRGADIILDVFIRGNLILATDLNQGLIISRFPNDQRGIK